MSERGLWVRQLRPDHDTELAPACSEATVAPIRDLIGDGAVRWAVRIADELAGLHVDETASRVGLTEVVTQRLGTESATLLMLARIYQGHIQAPYVTGDGAVQIQDFVHRHITLTQQWAQIRRGHAFLAEKIMEACVALVPVREQPQQLRLVSKILFEFIEGFATEVGLVYDEEQKRWAESAIVAREAALRLVLDNGDVDLEDASFRLSYDIAHRHHVGLVLSRDAAGRWDEALLDAARNTLKNLGARQSLLVPQGHAILWAWGNATHPLPRPTQLTLPSGISLYVGRSGPGADGFRSSHSQAVETYRMGRLIEYTTSDIVHYDDVSLLSLLLADPNKATDFVEHELGDLAKGDAKTRDLRQTLQTYLETHSPQAAAQELHLARNTVTYRLRRAEEVLGRPLSERQLETWTALHLLRFTRNQPPNNK